ncbi:AraC family transcriptional regulator [Occallatibacter savannae]|uniref:AraC family transcriptional regulator n=1 Tax=Occallatibacter savannae TaxID=1002691 RepID=UPI000D69EEEE|nr:AraC family transcriptional regulator [Occallatibacter savannae]
MPALPQVRWAPAAAPLGSENCVLAAQSRRHSVRDFPGPLSIKTVTRGRVAWRIDRRDIWVDESTFLILNDGEPYSMEIDAAEPVSTCCIFFKPGFVQNVLRDLYATDDQCLEDPTQERELLFPNRLHSRTATFNAWIASIRTNLIRGTSAIRREECYLGLASELAAHSKEIRKQLSAISAAKAATRFELLQRVSRGREYLHACPEGTATLAGAAKAAAMSPFHFQRTFKTAFGMSPSRYVAGLRFSRAASLLRAGTSVTESALAVGFGSTASFSTAFRRWSGVTPSTYAAQLRKMSKAPRA